MSTMKTLSIVVALVVGAGSLAVAQTSTTPTTPSPPAGSGAGPASPGTGPAGGGAGTVSGKPGAETTNNRGPGKNASVHKASKHRKKPSAH
jgi:hypothetical protein